MHIFIIPVYIICTSLNYLIEHLYFELFILFFSFHYKSSNSYIFTKTFLILMSFLKIMKYFPARYSSSKILVSFYTTAHHREVLQKWPFGLVCTYVCMYINVILLSLLLIKVLREFQSREYPVTSLILRNSKYFNTDVVVSVE